MSFENNWQIDKEEEDIKTERQPNSQSEIASTTGSSKVCRKLDRLILQPKNKMQNIFYDSEFCNGVEKGRA